MSQAESVKVVLLGEQAVGKTSIISRFTKDTFDSNVISSLGASFTSKIVNFEKEKRTLKFDIWDTAGQEKYRSLAKIFYKDAKIIIFVYDICRKASFEAIKNYWYDKAKESVVKDQIFAVAANKCDLYEKEQVSESEGQKYAEEIGAIFKTTSALSNTGINILFDLLGKKFINPEFDYREEDKKLEAEYLKKNEENSGTKNGENERESVKLDAAKTKEKPKGSCNC